jgi:hypothetical protein
MLFREIQVSKSNLDEIKESILSLKSENWLPIILRGGDALSKIEWWNFLTNECRLVNDQRQYNYDESLEYTRWWEISNQPEKETSYAFSTTPQPLHSDNAWFGDPAEINFFIMQKQAKEGGNQKIYPLSRLMQDLDKEDKSLLHDLQNTEVTVMKGDGKFFNKTTIIKDTNDIPGIYWNYYRTQKENIEIEKLCERFFNFLKEKEKSDSVFQIHANTGDCFCFNDSKMLHGRTAIKAEKPKDRVLLQSMWYA